MAKILLSAVVGDARNKVGDAVFSTSRSGRYIRLKAAPSHPVTMFARNIRVGMKNLSISWGWVISASQRADWIAWAANPAHTVLDVFNNSIYLTGLNWYVWVNQNLKTIGEARRDDVPTVWEVGDPTSCTTAVGGPPYVLTVDPLIAPGANDHAVVQAAPPLSAGRAFIGKTWRIVKHYGAAVDGPYDITTEYEDKFGPLQAGQTINCSLFYIDDRCGKKSAIYSDTAVVP